MAYALGNPTRTPLSRALTWSSHAPHAPHAPHARRAPPTLHDARSIYPSNEVPRIKVERVRGSRRSRPPPLRGCAAAARAVLDVLHPPLLIIGARTRSPLRVRFRSRV